MATIKTYTDFRPIDLSNSNVRKQYWFNDVEMICLGNYTTFQEFKVLLLINLHQKYKSKPEMYFRIPYSDIEEKTGLNKNLIKRHLKTLQEKRILHIEKERQWMWNIPGIARLLKPAVKEEIKPSPPNRRSDQVVFIHSPVEDPILKGLPKDWDKI